MYNSHLCSVISSIGTNNSRDSYCDDNRIVIIDVQYVSIHFVDKKIYYMSYMHSEINERAEKQSYILSANMLPIL